ncbi:MAG: glycosyltransferase family 4 protein [Scytonematopsis contorta HA4267-MV1]|jgi:glycosyltransferase involved in cell wall biosynthesis|nr:glycosyltransferase family 4 protein [Scytonematopsis contorta HA4267-MV1]
MKIAVIGAKGLPPKQGGIEHYCAELYPRIVAQGHSVDLFARCSYTNSHSFNHYDFHGIQVINLPGLPLRGVDAFVTSALGVLAAAKKSYDIIHFHALGPSLFTYLSKVVSSTKIVVTCQGLDWQRAKWGTLSSNLIYQGEKAAVKFADRIVVVSHTLQSYFLNEYGRETVYIPNAPASYLKCNSSFLYGKQLNLEPKRYIVFLGRLVPEKRPELLVEAFIKLKSPDWKLVIVGGISDTKQYTAKLLNIITTNPNIIYAGELWGERKSEIIQNAGLFVLPSDLEGLPLAMLEAMHEGVPVVASNIPPHQQLIGINRGVLFQSGSVDKCVDSLSWAIQNPEQMQKMAANAKLHVEVNYSWESITTNHLNLYSELLDSSSKSFYESFNRRIFIHK